MNPITLIDGYKFDHRRQYPKGLSRVYANWTPRESRVPGVDRVVFFGLQRFLIRYLQEEFVKFFSSGEDEVCREFERRHTGYLGPNGIGSDHVRALHQLGYIPLVVRALPEGTRVPLRVPMVTVENTHDDFGWLTNHFETLMSNQLWLPCTSATTAYRMRQLLDEAALRTGSDPGFVAWQGHDFSFRGMPGVEAAVLSGMGHLLSFTGTDTVPAIEEVERSYGPLPPDYLVGGSVAATEHSVMCAGGELGELETFERILDLYPSGVVSVVSDTWDLWRVVTQILPQLRDRVTARAGKLVVRPDSGDPADIVCGDPLASFGSPANKGVIQLLWDVFGGTTTSTGHRLLAPCIGCIYGDSITVERARDITDRLASKGFASANMVFGVGSYSYQHVTRDTYGFAMKATWCEVDGVGRDIFKKPVTGDGMKNSAKGRLAVTRGTDGMLQLINQATPEQEAASLLEPVWCDGEFVRKQSFDEIRQRLQAGG